MDYFVGFKVSSNATNEKFVLKNKQLMDNDDNFTKINLTKEDIDIINQKIQNGQGNPPGQRAESLQQLTRQVASLPNEFGPGQGNPSGPGPSNMNGPSIIGQPKVVTLPVGWKPIQDPANGRQYFQSIDGKITQPEVPRAPYLQPQPQPQ